MQRRRKISDKFNRPNIDPKDIAITIEKGSGILNLKFYVKVKSASDPDKTYGTTAFVSIKPGSVTQFTYKCDCPAFAYHDGLCKHIRALREIVQETDYSI